MTDLIKNVEQYAAAVRLAERHGNKHGDVDMATNAWRKCKEYADALEAKEIERQAALRHEADMAHKLLLWGEQTALAQKERDQYKALCDKLGEALEEAMYSNSTKKSQGLSASDLAAWREMK